MEKGFNFEKAVQELLSGKKLTGKDGILTPLIKELVETALEAVNTHLNQEHDSGRSNRRNGYNTKTIKSSSGKFELDTPRDRNGGPCNVFCVNPNFVIYDINHL
jgi:transposase-like protein